MKAGDVVYWVFGWGLAFVIIGTITTLVGAAL